MNICFCSPAVDHFLCSPNEILEGSCKCWFWPFSLLPWTESSVQQQYISWGSWPLWWPTWQVKIPGIVAVLWLGFFWCQKKHPRARSGGVDPGQGAVQSPLRILGRVRGQLGLSLVLAVCLCESAVVSFLPLSLCFVGSPLLCLQPRGGPSNLLKPWFTLPAFIFSLRWGVVCLCVT